MALLAGMVGCGQALFVAFDQDHLLVVVDLPQLDLDDLAGCGLHVPADETGLDGQLAMTAVDQHQQLYAPRTAMVKERVQRRAYGSAGVENIVDQNDVAPGNVEADGAGNDDRPNIAGGKVVAVEVDVENSGIDRRFLDPRRSDVPSRSARGTPRRLMPTRPRF